MKQNHQQQDPKGMFFVNGEPKIVTETRRKILTAFEDLEFIAEGHQYFLNGKSLPSVSSIGERYIRTPFNKEMQAKHYAEKHGETAEFWIREWEKNSFRATSLGSRTHAYGESLGYLRVGLPELIAPEIQHQYIARYNYLAPLHPKEEAVEQFINDLPPSMHLVLSEAKVYSGKNPDETRNLKEQICGTFDMLYYFDGNGDKTKAGFFLMDYKTNTHLKNDYNRRVNRTLKEPFHEMIEEEISLYTIQLSLYALMLEDIGIPISDRVLIWLKGEEKSGAKKYERVQLPDISELLRSTL